MMVPRRDSVCSLPYLIVEEEEEEVAAIEMGWWGVASKLSPLSPMVVRHMSRARAENLRKINPRVSPQEASSIARSLYQLLRHHSPLSIASAWTLAQESGIAGLNSKTHMKLMLKWMRGRNMLKLRCNHVGTSTKKFLLETTNIDGPNK